jgi:nitrile hydratase
MDGVHDLGGMDGFGPVPVEREEPVFHSPWEGRVLGMLFSLTVNRIACPDAYRHAVERMNPAHYLAAPYYERMLTGVATLLVESGVLTHAQLEARAGGRFPLAGPVRLASGTPSPTAVSAAPSPRFALGDRVLVRNLHPHTHTRCPRYVRGKRGEVVRVDAAFRLPDVAAHRADAPFEPTYSVRFTAAELWGDAAGEGESVCVDLWQSYLLAS